MPRMLSLWLDYGAEVADVEKRGDKTHQMQNQIKAAQVALSALNQVGTQVCTNNYDDDDVTQLK